MELYIFAMPRNSLISSSGCKHKLLANKRHKRVLHSDLVIMSFNYIGIGRRTNFCSTIRSNSLRLVGIFPFLSKRNESVRAQRAEGMS